MTMKQKNIKISLAACILFLMSAPGSARTQGTSLTDDGSATSFYYEPSTGNYEAVSSESKDPKAYLGVMIREAKGEEGLEVVEFLESSPVQKAGIPEGAILLTLNGKALTTIEVLLDFLQTYAPGDVVTIRFLHDGKASTANVTLGERPSTDLEKKAIDFKVDISDVPEHPEMRKREHKRKHIIIHKAPEDGSGRYQKHENTLIPDRFSIDRDFGSGQVKIGFDGPEGKVEVFLMKQNGDVIEMIVLKDLQGPFEHQFDLGPGAQGTYRILIRQGDRSFSERIHF